MGNVARWTARIALTVVLLFLAVFGGARLAAEAYPQPPTTCHQLYWLTLSTGSPEPYRYQPDGIVLADGETRCEPGWWVRVVWYLGGRR